MSKSNGEQRVQRILILGGTGEARRLARVLVADGHEVTSALAGRTQAPIRPEGALRIGGFGGAEGLADWIADHGITLLIDATHPFAARISANAVEAAKRSGVRLIRLERPAWTRPDGGKWIKVTNMEDAAAALPSGARALLTIGRQEVAAFFGRGDCRFVTRVIEAPETAPEEWTVIAERGPFTVEGEMALLQRHGITHVVSKNAGGDQARAKIDAAAALGVPVVMIGRPALPEAETADSVEGVLARINAV